MKILIGITGEKGSGKETAGEMLRKLIAPHTTLYIRSSDILRETLSEWSLPITRHNLQYLAVIMNKQFGDHTLSNALAARLGRSDADVVIFDGVRWKGDEELVRSADISIMIYVTASPKIRFERLKHRNEKVGESAMTYAQFLREEQAPTELYISEIGKHAECKINNDGSLAEFKKQIIQAYTKHIAPRLNQDKKHYIKKRRRNVSH